MQNQLNTPFKNKGVELHAQLRSQHIASKLKSARQINLEEQAKNSKQSKFKQICNQLDADPTSLPAVLQLRKFCRSNAIILSQKKILYLLPILQKQFSETKIIQNKQQKSSSTAIAALFSMISLLVKYAIDHPRHCIYSHPRILNFLLSVLKQSTEVGVRQLTLDWAINLATYNINKKYMVDNGLLKILAEPQFKPSISYVEAMLTVLFDHNIITITNQIIDELLFLFQNHQQIIFTQWSNCQLKNLNFLAKSFTERIQQNILLQVHQSENLQNLLTHLLNIANKAPLNNRKDKFQYANIICSLIKILLTQTGPQKSNNQQFFANFSQQDYQNLILDFETQFEDQECRNETLIVLSGAFQAKCGSQQSFKKLANFYQKAEVNTVPHPCKAYIKEKQKKIMQNKYEITHKEHTGEQQFQKSLKKSAENDKYDDFDRAISMFNIFKRLNQFMQWQKTYIPNSVNKSY